MSNESNCLDLYEKPVLGLNPEDCFFYHVMDLPGDGTVGSQWDIRSECDNYLGSIDFAGKRVLDIGAASGFLTFEMEKRGADVVSFDMVDATQWDVVPSIGEQGALERDFESRQNCHRKLRNAYWYTHEKLNSKAKVFLGNVYDLPEDLGAFDIVYFGMILGHLQNPFKALETASRLCKESVVVANQALPNKRKMRDVPFATFMPSVENKAVDCWWALSDQCITQMLEILGFKTERRVGSSPRCCVQGREGVEACSTTVTKRYAGTHVQGLKNAA